MSTAHPHAQLWQCSGLELCHPQSQRKQNKRNNFSPGLQKRLSQRFYWSMQHDLAKKTSMRLRNAHCRKRAHEKCEAWPSIPTGHVFKNSHHVNLLLTLQGALSPNFQLSHNIMELMCLEMMHYGILFSMGR